MRMPVGKASLTRGSSSTIRTHVLYPTFTSRANETVVISCKAQKKNAESLESPDVGSKDMGSTPKSTLGSETGTSLDRLSNGSEALRFLLEKRAKRRVAAAGKEEASQASPDGLTPEFPLSIDSNNVKHDTGNNASSSSVSLSTSDRKSQRIKLPKDMSNHGFFAAASASGAQSSPVLQGSSSSELMTYTKIKFWIHLHINYGEHLVVVGSLPELGGWVLSQGIPMSWSEGDMWQAEVEVPAGGVVEYKYVIANQNGDAVSWQTGNNSVLAIRKGDERLDVYDNWYGDPGALVSSPGSEPVTRENRLLAWASELEASMGRQRQELRRVRMELATAQEEARTAREEIRRTKAALAVAEGEKAAARLAQRQSEARNRVLQAQLEETTKSFKSAIETAVSLIEKASTTSSSTTRATRTVSKKPRGRPSKVSAMKKGDDTDSSDN